MKKIFIVLLTASSLYGCTKLEEIPYDQSFASTYYKNAAEAEAALVAVYGSFQDLFGGHYPLIAETAGDLMFPRNVVGRSSITLYTYEPTYSIQQGFGRGFESPQQGLWQPAYQTIEKANWIIERVPFATMPENRRNEIIGEALFLRALMHFTLTKNFNEIPLKLTPSNSLNSSITGKSTKQEIYKSIYDDLNDAASKLPDYSWGGASTLQTGRASRQAAQLLHAKAALYNEDWALALEKAKTVLASGRATLVPSVLDLFDVTKKSLARQEMILSVEANNAASPPQANNMFWQIAPMGGAGVYTNGPSGGFYVYQSFYNSFDPTDNRRLLLDTTYVQANGTVVSQRDIDPRLASRNLVILGKYKDRNAIGSFNNNLLPIIRYADAFLIAAEAEARLNGPTTYAYEMINTIRDRAGIDDLPAGLNKEAFIDAVIQERAWEFFGEADRWYDLTRTNKFLTMIPLRSNADYPVRTPQPKHRYFPIPQVEITANPKLTQNPDWQ